MRYALWIKKVDGSILTSTSVWWADEVAEAGAELTDIMRVGEELCVYDRCKNYYWTRWIKEIG